MLLLAADAALVVIHLLHVYAGEPSGREFSLELDRGYGEFLQYVKWFWTSLMLAWLFVRTRHVAFCSWALVFAMLLADDALLIHEELGIEIADRLGYAPFLGLRGRDLGEVTYALLAGIAIVLLIAIGWHRGTPAVRRITKRLTLLLGAILFFGVGLDMLHVAASSLPATYVEFGNLLAVFEDGGEMVAASVACWYVYTLGEPRADGGTQGDALEPRSVA